MTTRYIANPDPKGYPVIRDTSGEPAERLLSRTFYSDSGHGWLRIPKADLKQFSLEQEITKYSYISQNFIYLEEDSDLTTYLLAVCKEGYTVDIIEEYQDGYSTIRNFNHYECSTPQPSPVIEREPTSM